MIETEITASYEVERYQGVHQQADTYKLALIRTGHAGTFNIDTANYSDLGADEVPNGNGYTTGGITLTGLTVTRTGRAVTVTYDTPAALDPSTISADGALIYNATRGGKSVYVGAFPDAPVVSTNGPFTLPMPAELLRSNL
jgi:hypothetical protein